MSQREIARSASVVVGASREPARSIREAVERLIGADDVDDAVAEWARGERG